MSLRRKGEQAVLRLGGKTEFRVVVVLDDHGAAPARPADVLPFFRRRNAHAAGKAVIRRDVQHGGLRRRERVAADAVGTHAKRIDRHAAGGVHAPASEKLDDEPVQVFRACADDDLCGADADAAAAREIIRQRLPQRRAAAVRRLDPQPLPLLGQHAPGRARVYGEGEYRPSHGAGGQSLHARLLRRRHHRAGAVADEVAAALAGLGVALVAQKLVGVLHRNDAQPRLPGQKPLGGQARAEGINAVRDVAAQRPVKLKIGALAAVVPKREVHLVISPVVIRIKEQDQLYQSTAAL